MTVQRLVAVCTAALLLACQGAAAGEPHSLQVGSKTREYYLHAPPVAATAAQRPLLIVLHGAGGWGRQAVRRYGWEEKAEREGFVVVGPDAWRRQADKPADFRTNPRFWNDAVRRGGPTLLDSDDVGFISALIDSLAQSHSIDRKRIYVTGFSSGAGMSQRLAAELADRIAAVAPVAGIVWPTQDTPSRPMPFYYVSGDADPLNPVAGGEIDLMLWGVRYQKTGQAAILERWRKLSACTAEERLEQPHENVTIRIWPVCGAGTEVRYALIKGLGHHWPGEMGVGLPENMVGPKSNALNGTDEIWRFLSRFRLP